MAVLDSIIVKRFLQRVVLVLVILALSVIGVLAAIGWIFTHPERKIIKTIPYEISCLNPENVNFKSRTDGINLSGWLIRSRLNKKTVIFAHGYGMNRLEAKPFAPLVFRLVKEGYNVMLFDFRNAGESDGNRTTIGQDEIGDLQGAVDFVKSHQELNKNIILVGYSMGAVVAIIVGSRDQSVKAVIADSPFADLNSYLDKSLSVRIHLPEFLNRAVLRIVSQMTGLQAGKVSPVREVKNFKGKPLLLIHETGDWVIPIENSISIKRAYSEAELWEVRGTEHIASFSVDSKTYIKKVLNFIELKSATP